MGFLKDFMEWLEESKKAKAAMLALVVALMAPLTDRLGLEVTQEQVAMVWGSLIAYVLGQGLADVGKESTRMELEAEEEDE